MSYWWEVQINTCSTQKSADSTGDLLLDLISINFPMVKLPAGNTKDSTRNFYKYLASLPKQSFFLCCF